MTDQEILDKVVANIKKEQAKEAHKEQLRKERNARAGRLAKIVAQETGVDSDHAFWVVSMEISESEGPLDA